MIRSPFRATTTRPPLPGDCPVTWAVIIANVHGAFLLIGKPASTGFVGLEEAGQIIAVAEAEQTEEDIFSSMV